MKRDLDFNEINEDPLFLKDSKDILDKMAYAIYKILIKSEDIFYLAMQGANERGFQLELFKYLNRCSEYKDHVELEYPIGKNNHLDMVIFNPESLKSGKYKQQEELLYLIELKHYSLFQAMATDHFNSRRETYLVNRQELTKEKTGKSIEIVCIELILEYNFIKTTEEDPNLVKKYRFPQRYKTKLKPTIENAKKYFENFDKDRLHCMKSMIVENDVKVTLHFFIDRVTSNINS